MRNLPVPVRGVTALSSDSSYKVCQDRKLPKYHRDNFSPWQHSFLYIINNKKKKSIITLIAMGKGGVKHSFLPLQQTVEHVQLGWPQQTTLNLRKQCCNCSGRPMPISDHWMPQCRFPPAGHHLHACANPRHHSLLLSSGNR